MKCPSCDAELPDDARFCIECGVILDRGATGPTVHLRPSEQAAITCAACGASNPDHAIFCVRCGQRIGDPAPQPGAPRPAIGGDVLPGPPPVPAYGPRPGRPRRRRGEWDGLSGAIFLVGIGVLFLSRMFWPGILIVIGLSSFVQVAGRGRIGQGVRNTFWLFGLAFLFMMPRFFFPGILILVGISALLEVMVRSGRRP